MRPRGGLLAAALGMGSLLFSLPGAAADGWPQWGGPHRDGSTSAEPTAGLGSGATAAPALHELWRRPVGTGVSAPVAQGDAVYLAEARGGEAFVVALAAGDGSERWRAPLGEAPELEFLPANTVSLGKNRLFALTPGRDLVALDTEDGSEVWRVDLGETLGSGLPPGAWTSPLLAADRLIVQVNGSEDRGLVAFDPADGAVVWTAPMARATHGSPALAELGGVPQVLVLGVGEGRVGVVQGFRLSDGRRLWSHAFEDRTSYSADLPLAISDRRVAVVTWDDVRVIDFEAADGDFRVTDGWAGEAIKAEVQPMNLRLAALDGHLYGFGGDHLSCLDAATGAVRWREKLYPGSLIRVGDHLVVLSQAAGLLRVVATDPAGYRELARHQIFPPGAESDTPPVYADGRIYARSRDELVAVALEAATVEKAP